MGVPDTQLVPQTSAKETLERVSLGALIIPLFILKTHFRITVPIIEQNITFDTCAIDPTDWAPIAAYDNERDALALVLSGIERNGPHHTDTFVLEVEDEEGELVSTVQGQKLADLARK
jgi:hypothetical protein